MVPADRSAPLRTAGRLLAAAAVPAAGLAAAVLLWPTPLADAFFAGWVLLAVAITVAGAVAAWGHRRAAVWVTAALMVALSILGMWSIGPYIAPAAILLVVAAVLLQLSGPRPGVREAIVADPPSVRETAGRVLAGLGLVAGGAGLVYLGAFARELFGACGAETLGCALTAVHWDALGVTLVGVLAVGVGGRLVWQQAYIARVLVGARTG